MKDYNLAYNYVYFNNNYNRFGKLDRNEYNAICLRDAENMEGVIVAQSPLYYAPAIVRKLFYFHKSPKINRYIHLPFKNLWYPSLFKDSFKTKKPICFVISGTTVPISYLKYLKNTYPDCKLVKLHRDLVKITYLDSDYSEEAMNEIFDLRMSFDKKEADKYGFVYFHEIESKIDIPIEENYPICDVFFAGKAKDRLEKLVQAYDIFEKAGLKCFFYITNIDKKDQVARKGIKYADHFMPYDKMLWYSVNSRCLFDVNQKGAVGFTSRYLEAIMYNKRLITDNTSIFDSKFYNDNYIQIYEDTQKIDPMFVRKEDVVDYQYQNEFSPVNLIKQIDEELIKRYSTI